MSIRVTVWNENVHEREEPDVADRYPNGIHGAVAEHLDAEGYDAGTATLGDPEHGLDEETLADTDVLVWWSHCANDEVRDDVADRVVDRVHEGMGFVPLHSGKNSKPFTRLMGTTCNIKYRHGGERERVWVVDPGHPIADGLDEQFVIPETETYGEPYDIPEPDRTVLVSWFEGGEVFRSGVCYRRGRGRIFAFRPGHEEYPIFHQAEVKRVIANAVEWAAPNEGASARWGETDPLEAVDE
ncbi:ThuA domain-containing protein [Halogeometricum sp. S1BR25-6]|uniref:ThuA domain-containing protein n=1 Tax=Halogeometricum salsisoli TaxID=2950536 RepID=A0ABU2GIG5_9EURY|nr:ThuA domain-containing protein [Halogeometricum sp. S1BR25-6]MDS0300617.1 ThuA domain-containing protein [Halogeometricum sp. S1BR25-6]